MSDADSPFSDHNDRWATLIGRATRAQEENRKDIVRNKVNSCRGCCVFPCACPKVTEPELVPVMLPRADAQEWVDSNPISKLDFRTQTACKRALRPEPPSEELMTRLLEISRMGTVESYIKREDAAQIIEFVEWAQVNGWEPE